MFCRWLSEENLLCATAAALIAKHGLQTPENKCLPQLYDILFWIFATFNISEKNVILLFNKAKSMAIRKHMNHKAYFEVRIQNQLQHEYHQRKQMQDPRVLFVWFWFLIGGERRKDKQKF